MGAGLSPLPGRSAACRAATGRGRWSWRPTSRPPTARRGKQTCAQHVGLAATVRDGSPSAATTGRSRHGEHHGARKPPGGSRDRRQQPGCLRRPAPAHQLGHASGSRICVANYASSMLGVAWGYRPGGPTPPPRGPVRSPPKRPSQQPCAPGAPCSVDMTRSRWQERSALIPSGAGCAGSNPAGGASQNIPRRMQQRTAATRPQIFAGSIAKLSGKTWSSLAFWRNRGRG
jgi:hypothetical protein